MKVRRKNNSNGKIADPLESIIRVKRVTASLAVASTNTFWCSKASKLYWFDFLSWATHQVSFRPHGFVDFAGGLKLPIHKGWLPLVHISTYTIYFSSNQRNSIRVSTPFFKHNQQVSSWFQPRARNMIPAIIVKFVKKSRTLKNKWYKTKQILLTIFVRPPHNYPSTSSRYMFLYNCNIHKNQLPYMQASDVQHSVHLSILDLFPYCPYL